MKQTKKKSWLGKKRKKELKRFVEYMVAGGAWFWSGYVIIVFTNEHIGLFAANFIGNAVGITLNFILERYWVFKTKRPTTLTIATQRYIVYTALNAFLLNYLILRSLRDVGIEPAIGQFIASGFFTVWNYFWYKAWVFKEVDKKLPKHKKPLKRIRHHA
jgi:putative flippase GtrA